MSAPSSAPTVTVRSARRKDAGAIVRFNAAMALETEHMTLDPAVLRAGVEAALADPRHGFYLVAESAGAVVACLMITYEWSDWRNGQWWWLQSVYVDPAFRRHGVFRRLYDAVEQRVAAAPEAIGLRLYVERDNARAMHTYRALGMHETAYRVYQKTLPRAPVPGG
jgi:ribosomal protein S18 acetylase RimI-like enzyme